MLIKIGTFPAICYSFILCSDKQFAVEYAFLVSYPTNFCKNFLIPQHIFKKWFHTRTKSLPPQSVTFLMTAPLALVRLSGWEEIKMKCSEGVNEMSGLAAGGGGGGVG